MTMRARRGFVLVAVLLLLVAMTVLTHGLLVLMREQRRAAEVAWVGRQARWAASGWVAREVVALDTAPRETVRRVERFSGGAATLLRRPLSREVVWVEAVVDSLGRARAAGLAWVLDAATRIASLPRAAEVGEWPLIETLDRVDVPAPGACEPETVPGATARPGLAVRPASDTVSPARPPGLGRLDGVALSRRLDFLPAAVGTPQPVVEGDACSPDPWNWGDPTDPASPCAGRTAGVVSPAGLHLEGGVGQGVVLVHGDLVLRETRFAGLLLVGGALTLEAGAEVHGVARVGGALRVGAASRFVARPCVAFEMLSDVAEGRGLGGALPLGRPGWLVY